MNTDRTCPECGQPILLGSAEGLCPQCLVNVGLSPQTAELGPEGTRGGSPPPQPPWAPEDIAAHFPQLEILACLGRGGMGVVYKARQTKLNRVVALKVLAAEKSDEPRFAERFAREAQALARLNHPNIVAVHDFGESQGHFYLIMEYVDGVTLRALLRQGHLPPEQALAIVPSICEALQYAHGQGVVHRDIKPENVLLDAHGRVKIADFGIAKIVSNDAPLVSLTEEQQVMGTPHYMAPEQIERPRLVDHRADIYSLGVVFYEMLTGELPLGNFQPPSRKVRVDVRLDEVVLHALEKEPERRYQHAREVKTDLEHLTAAPAPPPPANAPQEPAANPAPTPPPPRSQALATAPAMPSIVWLAVALLGVAGIGKWIVQPSEWWAPLINLLLAAGLAGRVRLAYLAILFFALVGVVVSLFAKPAPVTVGVLFFNALVAWPVLRATSWFFPKDPTTGLRQGRDFLTGLLFSLPSMLFLGFLRGGYGPLDLDLDADVKFQAGLIGLPLGAVGGGFLVLALRGWLARFGQETPLSAPTGPLQWSGLALAAGILLGCSLPLGGAGVVMLDLLHAEDHWNPGPQEAFFVLFLGSLAAATIPGSALLGRTALARMSSQPNGRRGRLGAVAAQWYWPCLLVAALLTSSRATSVQRAELQRRAAALERREAQRALRSALPPQPGFEPAQDVALHRGPAFTNAFLQLETGRVLSLPSDLAQTLRATGRISREGGVQILDVLDWMRAHQADLVGRDGPSGLTLVDGMGLLAANRGAASAFDLRSAEDVRRAADSLAEGLSQHRRSQPQQMAMFWFDPRGDQHTWIIRTRTGRAGLLELHPDDVQADTIRFRYKLVSQPAPTNALAQPASAEDPFRVRLPNGAELEVVAVCRNPRAAADWWRPDGTRWERPPLRIITLPPPVSRQRPNVHLDPDREFLVFFRWTLPDGVTLHSLQPRLDPAPTEWELPARVYDLHRSGEASAELAYFDNPPARVDLNVAASFGPWSTVSVYDVATRTARDVEPRTMALWSEPRYDTAAGALRYDVMHNVDRDAHALRMRARSRGGQWEEWVFHSGPLAGSPAKGFALVHGTEPETRRQLDQVDTLHLEQTPWIRGKIPNLALERH